MKNSRTKSSFLSLLGFSVVSAFFFLTYVDMVLAAVPLDGCKLEISKSVDKTDAHPGDTLTYTIDFKNTGTGNCTGSGVRIEDTLDLRLTFLGETHSSFIHEGYFKSPLYQTDTRILSWGGGEMTPGSAGTIVWKATINQGAQCGDFSLPNTARITSKEYTPNDHATGPINWLTSNEVETKVSNACPPPGGGGGTNPPPDGGGTTPPGGGTTPPTSTNGGGGTPPPGGGGGMNQPTVVLLKKATTSGQLAFVYLSQVPYTGLVDHWPVIVFFAGLFLWSIVIAYFIRSKKVIEFAHKMRGAFAATQGRVDEVVYEEETYDTQPGDILNSEPVYGDFIDTNSPDETVQMDKKGMVHPTTITSNDFIPNNLPVGIPMENISPEKDLRDALARRAREHKALISDDALKLIIENAHQSEFEALPLLERLLKISEEKFQKEDGWLLINKQKMVEAVEILGPKVEEIRAEAPGQTQAFSAEKSDKPVDPKGFLLLIARGESGKIFAHLRGLKQQGKNPEQFVKSVIYELDRVYRSRVDSDTVVPPELTHLTAGWTNEQLEEMISILLTIIEQSYKNSTLGLKLAVMRILDLKQFRA